MRSLMAVVAGQGVLAAAGLPAAEGPKPGGVSKASVNDQGVMDAAQFAVKAQQQAMWAAGKGEKLA